MRIVPGFLRKLQKAGVMAMPLVALLSGSAAGEGDESPKIHPTRFQRRARGIWRPANNPTGKPSYIALDFGESKGTMWTKWPCGLGCWNFLGKIQGSQIHIDDHGLVATITVRNSKSLTVSLDDEKTVTVMKKVKNDPVVLCE